MKSLMVSVFRIIVLLLKLFLVRKVYFYVVGKKRSCFLYRRTPLAFAAGVQQVVYRFQQLTVFFVDKRVARFKVFCQFVSHFDLFSFMSISVVEKSYSSKGHYHTVFVAGFYNVVVPYGAARFGDVLYAASVGSFDIVAEGEEGVGA